MTLANKVTIFRVAMVPVFLVFMYLNFSYVQWVAMGVFVLAALTDLVDGHLARSMNQITTFGKFMDPIADKLLVMSAFIVLAGQGKMHEMFAVVFVAREFIVSGLRQVAASQKNVIAAGWLGKIKTVTQIVAVAILIVDNVPFSLIGVPMDKIAVWVAMAFTIWSGVDYLYANRAVISPRDD